MLSFTLSTPHIITFALSAPIISWASGHQVKAPLPFQVPRPHVGMSVSPKSYL